jgi:hypothetical protein
MSVIYDDFTDDQQQQLEDTFKKLGKDRVYHIDINPF